MSKQSNLTVKGQVTIPKDVRDALGLRPGEPVTFAWNEAGEVVVRKGDPSGDRERRRLESLARIDRVRAKYAHLRTGGSVDEFMGEIREPVP
jgi:AbrB family looped-hinge helix DNA binding protein